MREVRYHRNAARYMRRMPADRKEQIKAAVAELAGLENLMQHPSIKPMSGDWPGCVRLRIGSYRAIIRPMDDEQGTRLEVLQVGPRGDVYKS